MAPTDVEGPAPPGSPHDWPSSASGPRQRRWWRTKSEAHPPPPAPGQPPAAPSHGATVWRGICDGIFDQRFIGGCRPPPSRQGVLLVWAVAPTTTTTTSPPPPPPARPAPRPNWRWRRGVPVTTAAVVGHRSRPGVAAVGAAGHGSALAGGGEGRGGRSAAVQVCAAGAPSCVASWLPSASVVQPPPTCRPRAGP